MQLSVSGSSSLKVSIPCPNIFNKGARCPACSWPSVFSVYPVGRVGSRRLTHAEATTIRSWRLGWESSAIALNLGPGQWMALASSSGPLQDTAFSLSPGVLTFSPTQGQRTWRALGTACNISLTKLFWEADSDGAGFWNPLMDLS